MRGRTSPLSPGAAADFVDLDVVTALEDVLAVVRGTSVADIEVAWGGGRVRVHRTPREAAPPAEAQATLQATPTDEPIVVKSGYVGVFHRDANAGLPGIGDAVKQGQALAEVATLSIRNTVIAPEDGILVELLVTDQSPVEYGQPLMVIDPAELR